MGQFSAGTISRFVLVGIVVVAVDAAVYGGLLFLGVSTPFAKGSGFLAAMVVSYFGNWRYTFRTGRSRGQEVRFGAVYAVTLAINIMGNELLLVILVDVWWSVGVAFLIITVFVAMLNYVLIASLVFRPGKPFSPEPQRRD
jgi:putative flippase GtrA